METGEGLNCVKDHIYVAQKGVKLHDNDQETQEDDNMEIVDSGQPHATDVYCASPHCRLEGSTLLAAWSVKGSSQW